MRSLLALLVGMAGLQAQSHLFVGPGGYPDIGAAVAAASPGDIITVAGGTYAMFAVDKGVTIRAGSGIVQVNAGGGAGLTAWAIPTGQVLHVVGIEFKSVQITGGRATFDDCFLTIIGGPALRVVNATVHLQRCYLNVFWAFSPAIQAMSSDLTVTNTSVIASGFGPLIALDGSRLHANQCWLYHPNTKVMRAQNGSTAWISDSTIESGDLCAFENVNSTIRTCRLTFVPGYYSSSCGTDTPGLLLGVDSQQPLRVGYPFSLAFRSVPGDVVFVFASPSLGTVDWLPLLEQPSWLDDQSSFVATALVTDVLGVANTNWAIPNNPALTNLTMWFKGVGGFPNLPLQATPAVGGIVR